MTQEDCPEYTTVEYRKDFGFDDVQSDEASGKRHRAFRLAEEIRRFEIELYWKRATYFWTFIAASLGAYLLLQTSDSGSEKDMLVILVSGVGTVFSFGWYLANRGSKFWQENWENHVDNLENDTVGPLYKVVLSRPRPKFRDSRRLWIEFIFFGPMKVSVSKINQLISGFIFIIWGVLLFDAVGKVVSFRLPVSTSVSLIVLTFAALVLLVSVAWTYKGANDHVPKLRKVTMNGENLEPENPTEPTP